MLMKTDTKHSVSFNSEGTLDLVELSLQRGATFEVQYMSTNSNTTMTFAQNLHRFLVLTL